MAEAIAKMNASDVFEAYSAGTETRPEINQTAVRIVKEKHSIDMNETQTSKLIDDIPEVDVVITMGCNVNCPTLKCQHREDWGLDDPSGKDDSEYIMTLELIEQKIENLKKRLITKQIVIK